MAPMCLASLVLSLGLARARTAAQETAPPPAASQETVAAYSADQLDSLVAPVALYSDALLAQVLVASTYPLEMVQLQQWMAKNSGLEGDALTEAVAEQPWDPAVQSMAAVPEAVERLANDIQWTTELGNAFLAQQADVMDAVQRMRRKAQGTGALETNEQQKVETVVVEQKQVIVVESASPEVIYVPSYSPTVVYGPPVYPYPPVYYPPHTAGSAFVTFGVGFVWGAAVGGSCCGIGWGHNDVNINIDNNFNRNYNRTNNLQSTGNLSNTWQHDPQHRGGTPYADRATADRYSGAAGGQSAASRQANAASQRSGAQASGQANRPTPSTSGRPTPSTSSRPTPSASERSAGSAASRANAPSSSGFTGAGASASGDRVGNRNIPSSGSMSSGSMSGGAFGGGSSSGFSGSSARASSARGASSMGGSRAGGGRRR